VAGGLGGAEDDSRLFNVSDHSSPPRYSREKMAVLILSETWGAKDAAAFLCSPGRVYCEGAGPTLFLGFRRSRLMRPQIFSDCPVFILTSGEMLFRLRYLHG